MIELDTSQAPRGVLSAQELVKSVAKIGDMTERHFLELKSTLDLSTKVDREKIAKFILGAANRMPDVAARAFEGYGVMIIGVAKDDIIGIKPVEPLEISKNVEKFVGAAGPHWDLIWVPIEGSDNMVLVIIVDPPLVGQPPFPCRASGVNLINGRIYFRADGETREANAEELDLLIKRGMATHKIDVDFGFDVMGEIASVTLDEESTIDRYIETTRERLLAALPRDSRGLQQGSSSIERIIDDISSYTGGLNGTASAFQHLFDPEERTEQEYIESIEHWEEAVRASWDSALTMIAASRLKPTVIQITNQTNTFFREVQVKLHLEGDIYAADFVNSEWLTTPSSLLLPRPPRKWGPTQRSLGLPYSPIMDQINSPSPVHSYIPSITFKNERSVSISLDVGDLRPRGGYMSEDEELVLVVTDRNATSIHGTWELTARDHNDVYSGEIDIPVTGSRDLTEATREILLLEDDNNEEDE